MPEKPTTQICPTCGTRQDAAATRCVVCGTELGVQKQAQAGRVVQGSRIPEITLSLPVALLLLMLFLAIGAVLVFFALRSEPGREMIIESSPTATPTQTATPTLTPTLPPPTVTDTPQPTPTPQSYIVQEGDTCLGIAVFFQVSVQSIVNQNNLPVACNNLKPGDVLLIPQPTPTITPPPTLTPNPATQTVEACERITYKVQAGDTPDKIATNYNVPWQAIRRWNGLSSDVVFEGSPLVIPLCERPATPGPTPTFTPPPPYAAANLLLPADGAPFTIADDEITLQWASVGVLRADETYMVKVEDITDTKVQLPLGYTADTKFIVPVAYRPKDNRPHIFRWTVVVVRQTGTDEEGKPVYELAGAVSAPRYFSWSGGGPSPTATP